MKKVIAWLLVLALTAAVSIGATLAYLTDTDEDVNVMTLGKVKIDQLEYERVNDETKDEDAKVQEFYDNKPLYPAVAEDGFDYTKPGATYVDWEQIGKEDYTSPIWDPTKINNEVDKMVFVKNKGDYDAFARSVFAFEAGNYETLEEFQKMVHLNLNEKDYTWEWEQTPVKIGQSTYFVATATYNKVLAPGALTEISLSQIALDKTATNADVEAFGDTYQVLVKSQAIQADGFDDPDTALTEGFGVIDANNVPWDNDNPNKGTDLKNALHYLNGDPTGTLITDSVTQIVFGKNAEYPEIVNNYKGYLVDVEQDTDAYAYYVDNSQLTKAASGYTVYVLSDGVIYAPKNSMDLFRNMANLETVNVQKLDVSRVESLESAFRSCKKLKSLDVSTWKVSSVTNMYGTFLNCISLEQIIGLENWDTSSVTTTNRMFSQCDVLTDVNLSALDLSAVTDAERMFYKCQVLEELDASTWNFGSLVNARNMFKYCYKLREIKGMGNWNTHNVDNLWDTFALCWSLESLEGLQNWDLSSMIKIAGTFQECRALTDDDVAVLYNWDMTNVEDISWMFRGCTGLVNIDLSNWDTSNIKMFNSMFSSHDSHSGSMNLVSMGIENWDMSSAENLGYMFYGCGQITDMDLSNWDVSNVTNMYHLFADCFKMVNYNFSGWNTEKVTSIDGIFNSNKALKSVDVSDFDTASITDFDQVFDGCPALEEIIGLDKWDTSNGVTFGEFLLNTNMKAIDLSSFNMSSAKYTKNMFHVNSQLTTIYVGDNWKLNPDQILDTGMFGSSPKLTGGNGSTVSSLGSNSALYARVDTEETPGLLTHINDKPVTP